MSKKKKQQDIIINPKLVNKLKKKDYFPDDSTKARKKVEFLKKLGWKDDPKYIIKLLTLGSEEDFQKNVARMCVLNALDPVDLVQIQRLSIGNTSGPSIIKGDIRPFREEVRGYAGFERVSGIRELRGISIDGDNKIIVTLTGDSKAYDDMFAIYSENSIITPNSKSSRGGDLQGSLGPKKNDHVFRLTSFVQGIGYQFGCYDCAEDVKPLSILNALDNALDYYDTHTNQRPPYARKFMPESGSIDYVYRQYGVENKKLSGSIKDLKKIRAKLKGSPLNHHFNSEAIKGLRETLPILMAVENQQAGFAYFRATSAAADENNTSAKAIDRLDLELLKDSNYNIDKEKTEELVGAFLKLVDYRPLSDEKSLVRSLSDEISLVRSLTPERLNLDEKIYEREFDVHAGVRTDSFEQLCLEMDIVVTNIIKSRPNICSKLQRSRQFDDFIDQLTEKILTDGRGKEVSWNDVYKDTIPERLSEKFTGSWNEYDKRTNALKEELCQYVKGSPAYASIGQKIAREDQIAESEKSVTDQLTALLSGESPDSEEIINQYKELSAIAVYQISEDTHNIVYNSLEKAFEDKGSKESFVSKMSTKDLIGVLNYVDYVSKSFNREDKISDSVLKIICENQQAKLLPDSPENEIYNQAIKTIRYYEVSGLIGLVQRFENSKKLRSEEPGLQKTESYTSEENIDSLQSQSSVEEQFSQPMGKTSNSVSSREIDASNSSSATFSQNVPANTEFKYKEIKADGDCGIHAVLYALDKKQSSKNDGVGYYFDKKEVDSFKGELLNLITKSTALNKFIQANQTRKLTQGFIGQVVQHYKNIFGEKKDNFEAFKAYIKHNDAKLRKAIDTVNSWEDFQQLIHTNNDSTFMNRISNFDLGGIDFGDSNKKFDSENGAWLTNDEITLYLLNKGYFYSGSINIENEGGVGLLYQNSAGQIIGLHNDGGKTGNKVTGRHWQVVSNAEKLQERLNQLNTVSGQTSEVEVNDNIILQSGNSATSSTKKEDSALKKRQRSPTQEKSSEKDTPQKKVLKKGFSTQLLDLVEGESVNQALKGFVEEFVEENEEQLNSVHLIKNLTQEEKEKLVSAYGALKNKIEKLRLDKKLSTNDIDSAQKIISKIESNYDSNLKKAERSKLSEGGEKKYDLREEITKLNKDRPETKLTLDKIEVRSVMESSVNMKAINALPDRSSRLQKAQVSRKAVSSKSSVKPKVSITTEVDHSKEHGNNVKELRDRVRGKKEAGEKIGKDTIILLERKNYGDNLGMQDVIRLANIMEHNSQYEKKSVERIKLPKKIKDNSMILEDAKLYRVTRKRGVKVIGMEGSNLSTQQGSGSEHEQNREQYMAGVINEVRSKGYNVIVNIGSDHKERLEQRLEELEGKELVGLNKISRKLEKKANQKLDEREKVETTKNTKDSSIKDASQSKRGPPQEDTLSQIGQNTKIVTEPAKEATQEIQQQNSKVGIVAKIRNYLATNMNTSQDKAKKEEVSSKAQIESIKPEVTEKLAKSKTNIESIAERARNRATIITGSSRRSTTPPSTPTVQNHQGCKQDQGR